jgi:hypothetical protein
MQQEEEQQHQQEEHMNNNNEDKQSEQQLDSDNINEDIFTVNVNALTGAKLKIQVCVSIIDVLIHLTIHLLDFTSRQYNRNQTVVGRVC